ncbi:MULTISPECIES: hypothetical protein [unclassified Nonomuraea]|uniref:hypothetical protein n=1 Tax=unclassified Nonomuraea TaxID=2593643 RepID=UPI003401A09B
MIIKTVDLRERDLAWHVYDLITDAGCTTWDQTVWRSTSQCGTVGCYATHVALAAGGRWLVDIDPDENLWIHGTPVTAEDKKDLLHGRITEYMIAVDGDPEHHIETVRQQKVIHVEYRAAHLLRLDELLSVYELFNWNNSAPMLAKLLEEEFGPRPRPQA